MAPLRIEVSGEGEISRQPEQGTVHITVQNKGEDQSEVVSSVQQTAATVQSQISPLAAAASTTTTTDAASPVVRWSSGAMSTHRHDEYAYEEATRRSHIVKQVFEATVDLHATFRDFERLSAFTRDLSAVPFVTVSNVEWSLTPDTQRTLRADVLRQAFDDAHAKAQAYAAAAGRPSVVPVAINEGGSSSNRPFAPRMLAMAAPMGGGNGSGEQTTLDYKPEDVKYSTSCNVTFEAE